MRVLIAARDVRVRRALSRLLELAGNRIVGATHDTRLVLGLDADVAPDVVVLELERRNDPLDLQVVDALVRRGRAVIAVSSGSMRCAAVLAAGARACLDKDAVFTDRLAEAVRAVAAGQRLPPPLK